MDSFEINPSWLTTDVVTLAKEILYTCRYSLFPYLSDALEEAGCSNFTMLNQMKLMEDDFMAKNKFKIVNKIVMQILLQHLNSIISTQLTESPKINS